MRKVMPADDASNENTPVQYPMNRGVPNTACVPFHQPCARSVINQLSNRLKDRDLTSVPGLDTDLSRSSTTSMTGTAIVAQITVAIANCNCAAITAAWGIGLELGELLIARDSCFRSR